MALGTITSVTAGAGAAPSAPVFHEQITVVGDDNYAAGGTAGFEALVASALGKESIELLYVVNENQGATYLAYYDKSEDKLMLRETDEGAEPSGDVSGTTLNLWVVYR